MKLTKSLAELDSAADELLAKSKAAEDGGKGEEENLAPEEVSDDSTSTPNSEEGAGEGSEEELEKCGDGVKKSDDPEQLDEGGESEEEPEEELEKCGDGVKKSDDPEQLDEGGESEEEPEEDEKTADEMEKSLKDDFQANEVIAQGMENSEFFSAVVEVLTKSLSDVQYDTMVASKGAEAANEVLAKSMNAMIVANAALRADNERLTRRINKLEKSITQGFEKIMDSLDEMSSQPAHMRKSMRAVNVHDKEFGASLDGVQTPGGFESLSKSQVLTVLNNELYGGNPNVLPTDIISYESGAPLRPDLQALVASKSK